MAKPINNLPPNTHYQDFLRIEWSTIGRAMNRAYVGRDCVEAGESKWILLMGIFLPLIT